MTLVNRGNAKLGRNVWHTNLPAGASCPGASEWCAAACYAKRGFYVFQGAKYGANLELLRDDPGAYEATLRFELAKLRAGSVFRIHTSGDFESVDHVDVWTRIARDFPQVTFYAYSRSHRIDGIRQALETFGALPNVHLWGSTDPTLGPVPAGWREARVFETADEARANGFGTVCPEQTGRKASCSDCGLCWNAKPEARLAFVQH